MGRWLWAGLAAVLGGIGLAVYLQSPVQPVRLAPPPPTATSQRPAAPLPVPVSQVYLPVTIPLASLSARLNRAVPPVFSGREGDPVRHSAVIEDTLDWVARRGPIQLSGQDGQLQLVVAATGTARVSGKVRAVRGAVGRILHQATGGASDIPFDVHADAVARLAATFAPQLQSDWHIRPNARASVQVDRAEVPIAGLATLDVRAQVRRALQDRIDHLLAGLAREAQRDDRLRLLAEREWNRLHKVDRLAEAPRSWLVVRPLAVAARPIGITHQSIELGIAIRAQTRIVVAEQAPDNPLQPLPPLAQSDARDGRLALNALATIPWPQLNAALAQHLDGRRFGDGGTVSLLVHQAEVSPWGERILLTLDLEAARGRWYKAAGRLHLTAVPRLDTATQTLHLDDLDYALETRDSLARAADWLLQAAVLDALREAAAIDLSPYLARARQEAAQAITRFAAGTPEGIHLSATLRDIALSDVSVTGESLQLTLQARADVHAEVTRLDP